MTVKMKMAAWDKVQLFFSVCRGLVLGPRGHQGAQVLGVKGAEHAGGSLHPQVPSVPAASGKQYFPSLVG